VKHIEHSPINNAELNSYLTCKDFTVSKEEFPILVDRAHDLLVTTPRPTDEELSKYYESKAYISHSDGKKSLLDKVYQLIRSYTLKQKIKLINSFGSEEKTILDIGAGTGDFLLACKNKGWKVSGTEPNDNARTIAEKKLNISLKIENSEFTSKRFDVITMWHVLEHVPNLTEYISSLKELLKPNGTIVIAVPNYKSYDALYYGKFWAAYDVPRHLWHFSQNSIKRLFANESMKVIKILPMKFDAFYVSLLSEKYKTGKMNPVKAFYKGYQSNLKAKYTKEYSSLIYIIKNS